MDEYRLDYTKYLLRVLRQNKIPVALDTVRLQGLYYLMNNCNYSAFSGKTLYVVLTASIKLVGAAGCGRILMVI